jgi:hypothetical protein
MKGVDVPASCDRKCQKRHFKDGHKEDCRLVGLKLRADAANKELEPQQVASDQAQHARDMQAHLRHLSAALEHGKVGPLLQVERS